MNQLRRSSNIDLEVLSYLRFILDKNALGHSSMKPCYLWLINHLIKNSHGAILSDKNMKYILKHVDLGYSFKIDMLASFDDQSLLYVLKHYKYLIKIDDFKNHERLLANII